MGRTGIIFKKKFAKTIILNIIIVGKKNEL